MRLELHEKLLQTYPHLFSNVPVYFDCGDGWYPIINCLFEQISKHTVWTRKQRAHSLKFNRALTRAINGDINGLIHFHTYGNDESALKWAVNHAVKSLKDKKYIEDIPDKFPPVKIERITEKYGALKVYFEGGDLFIKGMIFMTQSISMNYCEQCGIPSKIYNYNDKWITTTCNSCYNKIYGVE